MADLNLDRATLKALSSELRADILKSLKKRRKTVTELAAEFKMSKSTLHGHLTKLLEVDLIVKNETYTDKFVYYELTKKAERVLSSKENTFDQTRIILLITTTAIFVLALLVLFNFSQIIPYNTDNFSQAASSVTVPTVADGASDNTLEPEELDTVIERDAMPGVSISSEANNAVELPQDTNTVQDVNK
jgi:DNA-binding transcriptional ArsR family regulator